MGRGRSANSICHSNIDNLRIATEAMGDSGDDSSDLSAMTMGIRIESRRGNGIKTMRDSPAKGAMVGLNSCVHDVDLLVGVEFGCLS
jgi:hypothetical protein